MKTTLQVVTDRYKRKFNIELLSEIDRGTYDMIYCGNITTNGTFTYDPLTIEVNDQLYKWFCEWFLCKDRFKRDIIIDNTKLIGCFISSLTHGRENIVELDFNIFQIIK